MVPFGVHALLASRFPSMPVGDKLASRPCERQLFSLASPTGGAKLMCSPGPSFEHQISGTDSRAQRPLKTFPAAVHFELNVSGPSCLQCQTR
jgi:hypothetical protein